RSCAGTGSPTATGSWSCGATAASVGPCPSRRSGTSSWTGIGSPTPRSASSWTPTWKAPCSAGTPSWTSAKPSVCTRRARSRWCEVPRPRCRPQGTDRRERIPAMTASAHHHHRHNHHAAQQHYYDEATNPEFEIRRPRGCGKIYEYLIEHKFRTGMSVLGLDVTGLTVLEVC